MKLLIRYMKPYAGMIVLAIFCKLVSTIFELTLPYILEHIVDDIVPLGKMSSVILWGLLMFGAALLCWLFNILANTNAVNNAHKVSYDVRRDLFEKTVNLSGSQVDEYGLPSLISRMTSDSYNVQSLVQRFQSLCVRAPMMLTGGLVMTLVMEWHLAMILVVMLPFLLAIVLGVSAKGIPMYTTVQQKLDTVVRIMRENITGIRVVKALSKTEYEKRRFAGANQAMASSDIKAATIMALPGPLMQLCINSGLALVVIIGAQRVNAGLMEPGVILAFLTYFNMINMGIMGLTRIFDNISKGTASANRIDSVLQLPEDLKVVPAAEANQPAGGGFIRFEHVDFSYGENSHGHSGGVPKVRLAAEFGGSSREKALYDIDFAIEKGESLGIIGPTGCGKTTILNLLMRFYDAEQGSIFVDGRDVRSIDKDELHRKFGVAFQNDMVFQNTLRENIDFSRHVSAAQLRGAVEDAMAAEYIDSLDEGLDYRADIRGANLSGGQKQRLLVARALAGDPEILVLDDSSSALDYRTDSSMRKAIEKHHADTTLILVAQRVSSVMNLDHIMVMDEGRCIGYGTHAQLLESCPEYRDIYETQMGAMA